MTAQMVPLGDICVQDRRTIQPSDPRALDLPYVGVEHVVSGSGDVDLTSRSRVGDGKSVAFQFDGRHVLYAKLRPYLNKVALPTFKGRSSTELVPLRPRDGVDREYLAHLLRRPETVQHVMASVTGARMPRTDMSVLMSMPVPVPPLEGQRRIVDILNRAASIRRLRDQANAILRALVPALFIKMFGDPAENPMGWEVRPLGDVIARGPHNGLYRPKSDYGSGTRILRIDGFYDGSVSDPADWQRVRLPETDVRRYALNANDC